MVSTDSIQFEAQHAFDNRLWSLLHKPTTAKTQYRTKAKQIVYGRAQRIGAGDLRKHLAGQQTLAVSCIRCQKALFVAFDIDSRFTERLDVFRAVLTRKKFGDAAFAITGSMPGRGKVVLTLAEPLPQAQAVKIANEIALDAQHDVLFGTVVGDFTVFPNEGIAAGNTVRLFGINLKRGTGNLCEAPLDLNGSLSDLWYVRPAQIKPLISARVPSLPGIDGTLHLPYTGNGATIAGDMLRAAWRSGKEAAFNTWCDRVLAQNDLTGGAREQLSRPDVRRRTWAKVAGSIRMPSENRVGAWTPKKEPPTGVDVRNRAWRIYKAAADLAVSLGRNPHCFAITYGHWADLTGYASKTACGKAVIEAEKLHLLTRIDRGEPRLGGLPTLIALVGDNETLQQAFDDALVSDEYQERLRIRAVQKTFVRCNSVVGGQVHYASRLDAA